MRLTERQKEITAIVRENGPITGEQIAERLHVTRSALRGDLAVLLSGEVIAARRRLGYYYLGGGEDPAAMEKARAIVKELTDKYPLHKNFGKDL